VQPDQHEKNYIAIMFADAHLPDQLLPQHLDAYLERGWFRMSQRIFTTNFVHFKDQIYSTVWLRILLDEYIADSTQLKLFKRNAVFRTTIKPASITTEKEELYLHYKHSLPFQPSESLSSLLYGRTENNSIFNTFEVTLHDGEKLIACGFFDVGEASAEGITSFYDPAYKKFSLGKYLIYLKIQHCRNLKLRYFYPGYFVPGYSFFNYKLTIGRETLEFLRLRSQQWISIETFSADDIPVKVMHDKLNLVSNALTQANISSKVMKYEFFDANLIPDLKGSELLDFPVFLFFGDQSNDGINPILVFDVRDAQYHLLTCAPIWKPNEISPDLSFYSVYFLKPIFEVSATPSIEEIESVILKVLSVQP